MTKNGVQKIFRNECCAAQFVVIETEETNAVDLTSLVLVAVVDPYKISTINIHKLNGVFHLKTQRL